MWKTWTVADGKQFPASVVTYNDEGKKEEVEEKFFKDGRLKLSETYKNGDLDGPFKEFFSMTMASPVLRVKASKKALILSKRSSTRSIRPTQKAPCLSKSSRCGTAVTFRPITTNIVYESASSAATLKTQKVLR